MIRGENALANHYQSGHNVYFGNAKLIHSERDITKRLIGEALLIRNNLTFNGNTTSFNLQIFG